MMAKRITSIVCLSLVLTMSVATPRALRAELPPAADDDVVVDAATESVIKGSLRYLAAKQYLQMAVNS